MTRQGMITTKEETDTLDFIKMQNFCSSKSAVRRRNKPAGGAEKIERYLQLSKMTQ